MFNPLIFVSYFFYVKFFKYFCDMESKKISHSGLKKVMSPKEMKNVTGGSGICDEYGSGLCWVECKNGDKACASTCDYAATQCGGGGLVSCVC